MRNTSAHLKRQKINLSWDNPELEELRVVAEEIWQIAYNDALTLADLHHRSGYCDWKIYRTVDEMVHAGLFSLGNDRDTPRLAPIKQ